jgi:hypothetical protein
MHAPGWYTDPHNPSIQRWWDGQIWTAHTRAQPDVVGPTSAGRAVMQLPAVAPSGGNPFLPPASGPTANPFMPAPHPLQPAINEAEQRLAVLRRELEAVEEAIEIQSFGFYRPKYGFGSSSEYEARLGVLRQEQKQMVKSGGATFCDTKWVVGGSAAEGKKMIERLSKLMLRAFNGECDAAIAKVRYDNVLKMEQRITKSCEEINKLGHSNRVMITRPYYESKLAELHLVHEHREKLQAEKDEQKRIREELREKDEAQRTQALEKARAELAAAMGAQHDKLEALVKKLETELQEAIDRKAKAIARAQLTKSGYVYVLSNVGSFGEGIFKIGLTRRLDPYERVDELGDASVPFQFDVHAIIYSEDAPALENALHKEFADRRVNMVNMRKEYFRVSIREIEAAVKKHHGLVTMVLEAEAEEYRKTVAMLEAGK